MDATVNWDPSRTPADDHAVISARSRDASPTAREDRPLSPTSQSPREAVRAAADHSVGEQQAPHHDRDHSANHAIVDGSPSPTGLPQHDASSRGASIPQPSGSKSLPTDDGTPSSPTTRVPSDASTQHRSDAGAGSPEPKLMRKLSREPTSTSTSEERHPHLAKLTTATHDLSTRARRRLHLENVHASGPMTFFNPTEVRMHVKWKSNDSGQLQPEQTRDERTLLWRSRDNRKRRASSVVPQYTTYKAPFWPRAAAHTKKVCKILFRMFFSFPYWDMAFWSGWSYTIGSALFVLDGAWAFGAVAFPDSIAPNLDKYGGPIAFFIGAILYQIGAVVAYLEAVNDGSFRGSAMRRFLEGHEDHARDLVDAKLHSFFSHFRSNSDGDEQEKASKATKRRGGVDLGPADQDHQTTYDTWRWWPSWEKLRHHHIYEIGYIACSIQLLGVTLYGVTAVVVLPGILTSLQPWQKEAAFWIPQLVASTCFLTASLLFTLETQQKWYKPEPGLIGWWLGVWAIIGSVGFLLLAIFGEMALENEEMYPWAEYQSDLTTIWGSAAYMFSGFLQWYEATDKRNENELLEDPEQAEQLFSFPIPRRTAQRETQTEAGR